MGLWERHVFPRLMDRMMRGPEVAELRGPTVGAAFGDVLEIGFGTGLNLPWYGSSVRSVTALDPLDALQDRVAARIAAAPVPVERVARSADERLPFDDARFDCVVTTWTLCSIPDAATALAEMRRVLRPGGRYFFLEHGESRDARVAQHQRWLEPLHRRIAGGCRLTRPIDALVRAAGFTLVRHERFLQPGAPRVFAEMFRGEASP